MKIIVKTFILLSVVILWRTSDAQIINIESQRIITDTVGWAGNAGISLAASRFTQSYVLFSANGHLQYKTENELYLAYLDYDIVNAGGNEFNNSGFGHLRYNRKLSEDIRIEAFTQLQYNSVTKIDVRYLNGVGLRLKLTPYETAKFYFGLAYMYEHEEILEQESNNTDHRISSYFTFTLKPEASVSFVNTTYAQPVIGLIQDYRISNDTRLNFSVTDKLRFNTSFRFLFDSNPPIDISSINYQVRNGLSYAF